MVRVGRRRPEDEDDYETLLAYWQKNSWTVAQQLLCPQCAETIHLRTLCPLYKGVLPKLRAMSTEILDTGTCECRWTLAEIRNIIEVSNALLDKMFDEPRTGAAVGEGQVWGATVTNGKLVDVRRIDQMMGEHDGEE